MARRLIAAALMVAPFVFGAATGCSTPPTICKRPRTETPIPYTDGTTEHGVYMTSDWDGELLYYPAGAYYTLHHNLGERPRWWQCWLSFERDGVANGSVALAAGNEVELKAIDDTTLTVLNGTCIDFWLLCDVGGTGTETSTAASGMP